MHSISVNNLTDTPVHSAPIYSQLPQIVEAMKATLSSYESSFLQVGSDVITVSQQAKSITHGIQQSAAFIREQLKQNSLKTIQDSIRLLVHFIAEIKKTNASHLHTLHVIETGLKKFQSTTSKIGHISFNLMVVAVNMSIQSSYIDTYTARFSSFIAALNSLADSIKSLSDSMGEDIESMSLIVRRVSHKMAQSMKSFTQVFGDIEGTTQNTLQEIETLMSESSAFFEQASQISDTLSQEIGEIVAGVQVFDIIRQKVEHCTTALSQCCTFDRPMNPGEAQLPSVNNDQQIAQIIGLQKLHIKDIIESIQTLHSSFHDHFRTIDVLINTLVSGTVDHNSTKTRGQSPVNEFTIVIQNIRHVQELVTEAEQLQTYMKDSVTEIGGLLEKLKGFMNTVELISDDLKLHAINAEILTQDDDTHMRSLNGLAQEVKTIAKTSDSLIGVVSDILQELQSTSATILDQKPENKQRESSEHDLSTADKNLEEMVLQMSLLYNQAFDQRTDLVHKTKNLDSTISGIESTLTFLPELKQVFQTSVSQMEKLVSSFLDNSHDHLTHESVNTLLSQYTMESERMIHKHYVKETGGSSDSHMSVDAPTKQEGSPDTFGDNVELF